MKWNKFELVASAVGLIGLTAASSEWQQVLSTDAEAPSTPLNIAVVGAGAAGASTAYHLAKFAASSGLSANITILERNSYIGGRSTTVNAYNDPDFPVELGASIFVKVNKILADAVVEFNLTSSAMISDTSEVPGAALGVWDGRNFVVTQAGKRPWWDIAKLLWRYGLAPVRTVNLMKATVGKFLKMYDEPVFPFQSLTKAVYDTGLIAVTAATGGQYMAENGITGEFGHDIVQASTRVNYAQNLDHIHGLEAMVCMATDGAMSVEGGNWQIFQKMALSTNATTLLNTKVFSIEKQKDDTYDISFGSVDDRSIHSTRSQNFDSVVLAAPHQFANISITSHGHHIPDEIPYVQLHVTLFTSPHLLSASFFNLATDEPVPKVVLTTLPPNEQPGRGANSGGSLEFFSISLLDLVTNPDTGRQEYLFKIFSPEAPNDAFFGRLLGLQQQNGSAANEISGSDITWLYRKVWNSYPYEYPRVTFEEIQLADNLWYTSGIESFISTMETSALMGMNVARLVVDQWAERWMNNAIKGHW